MMQSAIANLLLATNELAILKDNIPYEEYKELEDYLKLLSGALL